MPPTREGEPLDPLVGQTIKGSYFVQQRIGGGGMGQVYKAVQINLDRPVALKLLRPSLLSDPSVVQRFHREARASSKLHHPNVIAVTDFGQTDDGTLFMAMEYVPGRNLLRVLRDEFPLGELRVINIGAQILAALGEAHRAGIIHRDLKPENVMVESRTGELDFVKVLDFGIAKIKEPGDTQGQLTQVGLVCGTPDYMSPEQASQHPLDARSDLYSVGIILYELLTGSHPFRGLTPTEMVRAHVEQQIPPMAERSLSGDKVSPGLEALVMRALKKEPAHRFLTADEMRRELLACPVDPELAQRAVPGVPTVVMPIAPWAGATPAGGGSPVGARAPRTPGEAIPGQPPRGADWPAVGTPPGGGDGSRTAPVRPLVGRQPEAEVPPPPPKNLGQLDSDDKLRSPGAGGRGRIAPRPPRRFAGRPLLIAGGAGVVAVLGLIGYFVLRPPPDLPGPIKPEDLGPVAQVPSSTPPPQIPVKPPPPTGTEPAPSQKPETEVIPKPEPIPAPTGAGPGSTRDAEGPQLAGPAKPDVKQRPRPPVEAKPVRPKPGERVRPPRTASGMKPPLEVKDYIDPRWRTTAESGQAIVSVMSDPAADVYWGNLNVGESPKELRVVAGQYVVRLQHPTHGSRTCQGVIRPGQRKSCSVSFF